MHACVKAWWTHLGTWVPKLPSPTLCAVVLLKIRAMAVIVAENRVGESLQFYLNKLQAKIEDSHWPWSWKLLHLDDLFQCTLLKRSWWNKWRCSMQSWNQTPGICETQLKFQEGYNFQVNSSTLRTSTTKPHTSNASNTRKKSASKLGSKKLINIKGLWHLSATPCAKRWSTSRSAWMSSTNV